MRVLSGSLKSRLLVVVAVAIVVTGTVLLLFGYFMSKSILREQVFNSMEAIVRRTGRSIQGQAENLLLSAELIASDEKVESAMVRYVSTGPVERPAVSVELEGLLQDFCNKNPYFRSIEIVLPGGEAVASCRADGADSEVSVPEEATEVAGSGSTWADFDLLDADVFLSAASGVNDGAEGPVVGVVYVLSYARDIQMELSDTSGLGSTGRLVLSKPEGGLVKALTVTRSEQGEMQEQQAELVEVGVDEDLPFVRAAMGETGEGVIELPDTGEVVTSYGPLSELTWGVTATQEAAEAFAPVSRLRNVTVIVLLVLFAGGAALSYLIARSTARPFEELQDGVKAFGTGDLTVRVDVEGGAEVEALAEEFNNMAQRLTDLYSNLEKNVEERTVELREANERLRELDELKSEFVSIASHELRSPMSSMKMGVSTVLNEVVGPLNEEQKLMLEIANRNIDRLTRLTSELLDLTRIEADQLDLEFEEGDLVAVAADVVEAEGVRADKSGLYLDVVADGEAMTARFDRDRIYQVIQNLVGNAFKFTEEGGIRIRISERDGFARVCVEDTGAGIPPEFMPTIFDKFSKAHAETKSEKRGTGLGLAICKGIVEAHGGTMDMESAPGEGTRICFVLPVGGPDEREEEDTDSR